MSKAFIPHSGQKMQLFSLNVRISFALCRYRILNIIILYYFLCNMIRCRRITLWTVHYITNFLKTEFVIRLRKMEGQFLPVVGVILLDILPTIPRTSVPDI